MPPLVALERARRADNICASGVHSSCARPSPQSRGWCSIPVVEPLVLEHAPRSRDASRTGAQGPRRTVEPLAIVGAEQLRVNPLYRGGGGPMTSPRLAAPAVVRSSDLASSKIVVIVTAAVVAPPPVHTVTEGAERLVDRASRGHWIRPHDRKSHAFGCNLWPACNRRSSNAVLRLLCSPRSRADAQSAATARPGTGARS